MELTPEINSFINDYVKELKEGSASIFVGAGISRGAGYVDWKGLLDDIATSLGLNIDKEENNLLSLAQYHVNKNGRARINKKILGEFTEEVKETENHRIIARLPFQTIWTTNYDNLIEDTCYKYNKIVDDKHSIKQLFYNKPKRDLILYKMHGDIDFPDDAILTKEDYERYFDTHEAFITTLNGELISKTFLFIGFSFSDPNIDFVLSRLNYKYNGRKKEHYCLLTRYKEKNYTNKADYDYNVRKQELFITELRRFGITTLLIDDYSDVTQILKEIEKKFKKSSIFISGSAEEYGVLGKENAQKFIHLLSKLLIKHNFRVINGFGLGVGSAVINGALDIIYDNPKKYSQEQLILKPFPQFKTGGRELPELWEEYRNKMISQSGISIFLFGNKTSKEKNINADGVYKEFEISKNLENIPIPIPYTGYISQNIFEDISTNPTSYYENIEIFNQIKELKWDETDIEKSAQSIVDIIIKLNK